MVTSPKNSPKKSKFVAKVPREIDRFVEDAIIALQPEEDIIALPPLLEKLGADPWDAPTKRWISRAMHNRGAETLTRPRNRAGGSYYVSPEVRAAVVQKREEETKANKSLESVEEAVA